MTDVYGIFGWPVAHSRSPAMHNAAFRALGIDATYAPFPVAPDALGTALRGANAMGVRGLNLTLPHKTAIMPLLDIVEPDAQAIGAVNTVMLEDGWLAGANTDAEGLARSLQAAEVQLSGARVTVVGAGGAARASVVGLARAGAARVTVLARRPEAASAMIDSLSEFLPDTTLHAGGMVDDAATAMADTFSETDLLVQATSATLGDTPQAAAFADALPMAALPTTCVVTDLVYKPLQTAVMARATARGLRCVDGMGMLLHQGALAFERWTGQPPPLTVMAEALAT